MTKSPGQLIRDFRQRSSLSLADLADQIQGKGCRRPSTAKLSRIETGEQPVPTDVLVPLVELTGLPARMLRPDLAELLKAGAEP